MKIGKYRVGLNTGFFRQSVVDAFYAAKDAVLSVWDLVYQFHEFNDGDRLVIIGPLMFTWKS